jgi:hypothetical protein
MLSGKKTFLVALAVVCYAIGGYLSGNIEGTHAIELVLGSGLAAAFRDAMRTKSEE